MNNAFWDDLLVSKKLYSKMMDPVAEAYGLTRMELDILLFLANNPGFDTATDITARRGLTKSHVSSSVKKLSERGFLGRSFQEGNAKTIHLEIQDAAAGVVKEGKRQQIEFGKTILGEIEETELEQFQHTLRRLSENMRRALEERSQK